MKYSINDVTVIIPNWNGKLLLEKHLPKVIERCKGAHIVVVDDASDDGSQEYLTKEFPNIIVVHKSTHEGFSSTVNAGVAKAKTTLVLLLNSDIEPEIGFLDAALPHFSEPQIFAVGLMDKSIEGGKTVFRGRGVATFKKGFYTHSRGEVDKTDTAWVSGGSGIFRKDIWDTLGGMDPLFNPFYWEDIDLSYRAQKAGYRIVFEPKSVVIHKHEEGAIKTNFSKSQVKRIAFRNQLIFHWKNISDSSYILSHFFRLPIVVLNKTFKGDLSFLLGLLDAKLKVPIILKKRISQSHFWKLTDNQIISASSI